MANADGEHHRDTPTPTEREVDHDRPGAQANVEGPVPSRRISFIREFALREGISAEALDAIWGAGKHGYIASYDPHFVRFESYHRQIAAGTERFSPRSITAGSLVGFLKSQEDEGEISNVSQGSVYVCVHGLFRGNGRGGTLRQAA